MNAASAQNYELLRFDQSELNDIRGGFLSSAVKAKFEQRLNNFGKIMRILYTITGVLFALCAAPFACMFGYGLYSVQQSRTSVSVFLFFALALIVVGSAVAVALRRKFKNEVNADLNGLRVNCAEGRIKIDIKTTRNNFSFNYSIGETKFKVLSDFIGTEIHRELVGGIMAPKLAESEKIYRVYYLPESKMILHYEAIF